MPVMRNLPSALVSAPYLSNPQLLYRRSETCALSIGIPLTELRTSPCTLAGFSSVFGGWVCARPTAAAASHSQGIALLLRLRIRVLQRNHFQVLHDPVAFLELDSSPRSNSFLNISSPASAPAAPSIWNGSTANNRYLPGDTPLRMYLPSGPACSGTPPVSGISSGSLARKTISMLFSMGSPSESSTRPEICAPLLPSVTLAVTPRAAWERSAMPLAAATPSISSALR